MLVTRQVVLIQHQILRQWVQIATLAKLQTETFITMANSLLLFLIMECATVSDAQVPANNFLLTAHPSSKKSWSPRHLTALSESGSPRYLIIF